jgi:predicted Fe-S protein YdhL (DUF1289 family)
MTIDSPCIRVCVVEPRCGYCRGCLRTLPEIAAWSRKDDAWKRMVLAQLKTRSIPKD